MLEESTKRAEEDEAERAVRLKEKEKNVCVTIIFI